MTPLPSWNRRGGQRRWLALVLVLLMAWPNVGLAELQLKDFNLTSPPAPTLQDPAHLTAHLRESVPAHAAPPSLTSLGNCLASFSFCSSVGGVAFGGVARAADGCRVTGLRYDAARPDGQRLRVTVAGARGGRRTLTARIHDWQLAPIARFAAADQCSCFTLFGSLTNAAETTARRARGEKIMNYHPAFADTLVGLRLFQADVLVLYPQACDLPKDDGRYVLGAGERPPDEDANRRALSRVHRLMTGLKGHPFQSYVICDRGVQVAFAAKGKELALTGHPIWYCWKTNARDQAHGLQLQRQANQQANRIRQQELDADQAALPPHQVRAKYTAAYQQQRHRELVDQVNSKTLLRAMPTYSVALSHAIRKERGINPVVYDSLLAVMRYAAFFRHVRQADPKGYEAFMASLADVRVRPPVVTPTVLAGAR